MVRVKVERVALPVGSTIGFVFGRPENDPTVVVVAGTDWRTAIDLGELVAEADEPLPMEIPDWAVLEVLEVPES